MQNSTKIALSSLFAAFVTGCAADTTELPTPSDEETSDESASAPSSEGAESGGDDSKYAEESGTFTQTIVTINEDGSVDVRTRPITLAQQVEVQKIRAMIASGVRVPETRAWDPGCAYESEWLFDQPNYTGNVICFTHPIGTPSPPYYVVTRHDLTTFALGSLSCGGTVYTTYWAGGVSGCQLLMLPNGTTRRIPIYRSENSNSVRSVYTGESSSGINSGVWFLNADYSAQNSFEGIQIGYPNATSSGRYVETRNFLIH